MVWGVHMERENTSAPPDQKTLSIGWPELGDLRKYNSSRDALKAAYASWYTKDKPGAIPLRAGVLHRFCNDMKIGDLVVYPSKADRMVNLGSIASDYLFNPDISAAFPHRRKVEWRAHIPRASFSQPALYEIGSAITLFQVTSNADEFLAAYQGHPFESGSVDEVDAADAAVQVHENVEDYVIKRLKSDFKPDQFEEFTAALLRAMGFFTRVTKYSGDGGVDVIAHRDELGFEPPIIKVQCKQTLDPIGGPAVQRLLGAIDSKEHALFVTLGKYSQDALRIERGRANLRLLNGSDLASLIFNNYDRLEARFKALLPLTRSYAPGSIPC